MTIQKELSTGEKLLALSWKEPFATLMLHGKIETRSWKTNYRGLVLICASKRGYSTEKIHNICGAQFQRVMSLLIDNKINFRPTEGYAIAIGRLTDCRPMIKADEEKTFVAYRPGLWCHIYEDVRAIKPFPFKGGMKWTIVTNVVILT